jgi:ubiquinone biosynthesis protein UbiJ
MPEVFARTFLFAVNHLLASADWARQRLHAFTGRVLRLEIGPLALNLSITEEGCFALQEESAKADVCVTLPSATPFLLLQDTDRVMQEARVSGNVEFAEAVSFVFRNLEWDVEADLAPLTGDILAHRLTGLGRALRKHLRQAGENLVANLAEYACHEARWLVASAQTSAFARDVDALRQETERLEKRLARLDNSKAQKTIASM